MAQLRKYTASTPMHHRCVGALVRLPLLDDAQDGALCPERPHLRNNFFARERNKSIQISGGPIPFGRRGASDDRGFASRGMDRHPAPAGLHIEQSGGPIADLDPVFPPVRL
jgi:hypothetical protein